MPLVRYELQNEHKLAKPELFSSVPNDDPRAVLEGVTMASMLGLVRQLGSLAEFAADLFHELHYEILATASRGHELFERVQHLEAELSTMEEPFVSESNQLGYAYSRGVKWHARIFVHQNHCSEGDLPQFIRDSYEKCRGPPKLFLLDKYDICGAGASQRRYTDPSFFKTKWADSELKRAESFQQGRRAQRVKKRNIRSNGKVKGGISDLRLAPRRIRYSSLSSDTWDSYSDISTPRSNTLAKTKVSQMCPPILEGDSLQALKTDMPKFYGYRAWPPAQLQTLRQYLLPDERFGFLRFSAKQIEEETRLGKYKDVKILSEPEQKIEEIPEEGTVEDIVSEEDEFVDAMTNVDSENESESRARTEAICAGTVENVREPADMSSMQCLSDIDNLGREEEEEESTNEIHCRSENQSEIIDLLCTELSCFTSSSHSSNYSTDEEENPHQDNKAPPNNCLWHNAEDFENDVSKSSIHDKRSLLPFAQMGSQTKNTSIPLASNLAHDLPNAEVRYPSNSLLLPSLATELCRESPTYSLPTTIDSSDQNLKKGQEHNANRRRERTKPTVFGRRRKGAYFLDHEHSLPKAISGDTIECDLLTHRSPQGSPVASETECYGLAQNLLKHESPQGSRVASERKSYGLTENDSMAEISFNSTVGGSVSPQPPTLSASSRSSSSIQGSPPRNTFANLDANAEALFSNARSSSSASSPKSPIFSALDSPMSPVHFCPFSSSFDWGRSTTAEKMRPYSLAIVPKLLPSPSLKGIPPPPLTSLKLKSKQNVHAPANPFLQAPPPPPPPPPPPRMISKVVQPISQMKQATRSLRSDQRNDDLIKSISTYDRSKLRKVSEDKTPKLKMKDEREILLEQIRNKTFNLRQTAVEKRDASNRQNRDNINVAAILERANAIRQAFAGSDEEDNNQDWTHEGQIL